MPNIIRIRDLISETNITEDILIPIDKNEYTDNAKKISLNDICEYCSTPTPPVGPYFTVTPSPQTIPSIGGSVVFNIKFYNFTWTKNWIIPGLSARTWNSGSGSYTITTSLTGVGDSSFTVLADSLEPTDTSRSATIPVYASGITTPQNGVINQYPPGYNAPSFTSFKFNGVTVYEVGVGTTVNSVTAAWLNTFPINIQANSIYIDPTVSDGPLSGTISGLNPDSSTTLIFNTPTGLKHDVPYQTANYKIVGINSIGGSFHRLEPSIRWNYYMYWGTSPNVVLNESQIIGLQNNKVIINNNIVGNYSTTQLSSGGYLYWCYPDIIGRIGFLENLGQPGQPYSVCISKNTLYGFDYSTNIYTYNGVTMSFQSIVMSSSGWTNYRVYRSDKKIIGSDITTVKIHSVI